MGQLESCASARTKEGKYYADDLMEKKGDEEMRREEEKKKKKKKEGLTGGNEEMTMQLTKQVSECFQFQKKLRADKIKQMKIGSIVEIKQKRTGVFVQGKVVQMFTYKFQIEFLGHRAREWVDYADLDRIRFETPDPIVQLSEPMPIKKEEAKTISSNHEEEEEQHQRGSCPVCLESSPIAPSPLQCGHTICKECFSDYVRNSLGDVSLFPLKCPHHHQGCLVKVTRQQVVLYLSPEEVETFDERSKSASNEASAGAVDRVISCTNEECKAVFGLNESLNVSEARVMCPSCSQLVYKHDDRYDRLVYEKAAKENGLQKCPSCMKFIEKSSGCNHMTHTQSQGCNKERCDFCYCCGIELMGGDFCIYEKNQSDRVHFLTEYGVFGPCRRTI